MDFRITILGANSAIPVHGRFPSGQFIQIHNQYILLDCGEGTQLRLRELGLKWSKIDYIFISHLHGDHFFGLPGFLTTISLLGREKTIHIFGPIGIQKVLRQFLDGSGAVLNFDLQFTETDTTSSSVIFENSIFKVTNIPLEHRGPTNGYRFDTIPQPRNIDSSKIKEYDLTIDQIKSAKAGHDLIINGKRIANTQLTLLPIPPKSYAYCSDTGHRAEIIPLIKSVNLLYHESTYLHEKLELAEWSKHTTAKQAGQIARDAQVDRLIIGHYSSRYRDLQPILDEARSEFDQVELALHGKIFEIS